MPADRDDDTPRPLSKAAQDEIRSFVSRIEHIEARIRDHKGDIGETLQEAEEKGYSKKAIKEVVKRRSGSVEQRDARAKFEEIVDHYMHAVGEFGNTPLARAASKREKEAAEKAEAEERIEARERLTKSAAELADAAAKLSPEDREKVTAALDAADTKH